MLNNPLREAFDFNLGAEGFAQSLGRINKIANISITTTAIVLEVDRRGGRFIIDRAGADNGNDLYSPLFCIRARLLSNFYNVSDGSRMQFDGDEIYCLPGNGINILEIPAPGDLIRIQFDKPFSQDSKGLAYWLGRESWYMTVQGGPGFKRTISSEGTEATQDDSVNFSGIYPSIIEKDYDIKPEWNYEPFPQRRLLSDDLIMIGKSNTSIVQTFNTHEEGNKRGLIAIETELDYIHNEDPLESFDFKTASESEIEEFKKKQLEHLKYHIDSFRRTDKWRWLNSNGVRLICGTKFNADRHLIHKESEKDNTGQYGNMQKVFDPNFRDQGPGPMPSNDDLARGIKQIGLEIEQKQIHAGDEYEQTHGDVVEVESDPRDPIVFDQAVATLFAEFEEIALISRNGGNIVHALLGEPMIRWLQRLLINQLHMTRTMDILRDRLNRLSNDFLLHFHPSTPGMTLQPVGSPKTNAPIKEFPWYEGTSHGTVAGDTDQFDEKGSDGLSMQIKDRTTEEREKIVVLIKELSTLLSNNFKLN